MLRMRSRSGVVGVTTGAAALLALPVVAAGQVPVVDRVVGGVTQTAQSLAPAPQAGLPAPTVKPAPPALPAPAGSGAGSVEPAPPASAGSDPASATPAPPASAPWGAPRQVTATGAPGSGHARRGGPGGRDVDASGRGASDGNGPRVTAAAAQDAGAWQNDGSEDSGSQGGGSRSDGSGVTDVGIAAGEPADDAGPASLPFTGLHLVLLLMLGLGAVAAGAALRRAT